MKTTANTETSKKNFKSAAKNVPAKSEKLTAKGPLSGDAAAKALLGKSEPKVPKTQKEKLEAIKKEQETAKKKVDIKQTRPLASEGVDQYGIRLGSKHAAAFQLLVEGKTMGQAKKIAGSTCYDGIEHARKRGYTVTKNPDKTYTIIAPKVEKKKSV
jgi:hypothetical protein